MQEYELVAGLETHVQLRTATKLFCGCATTFGAPPNSQVCPVCLGHPGVLPAINRHAVDLALRVALALNCQIAPFTKFDRKNYFYPDLPKNYQISQYDIPISHDGWVDIDVDSKTTRIGIIRAHLEEDAGKLLHQEDRSLVDLNRCGIPLVEIVTKPDFRSTEEAGTYLATLKAILQYTEASECDMEKGELRCDVNLSVRPKGASEFGTRVEIKNLNSFRNAQRAMDYEFKRQVAAIEAGHRIDQETRLFDAERGVTETMRSKEEAHDYRYFPEPDLPPLKIGREWIESVRSSLPELPATRCARFIREFDLSPYDARILTADRATADFFERSVALAGKPKTIANWIVNEVQKVLNENKRTLKETPLTPRTLIDLLAILEQGSITSASAKEALAETILSGKAPADIVRDRGLAVVTDLSAIETVVQNVIATNQKAVGDFKSGKEASIKFLVGQVMKETKGRVKAQQAEALLRQRLLT